ncbi:UNVERIFIED_CONTAM: hypothetical protein FKN15_067871 [Acipenser sinensis]
MREERGVRGEERGERGERGGERRERGEQRGERGGLGKGREVKRREMPNPGVTHTLLLSPCPPVPLSHCAPVPLSPVSQFLLYKQKDINLWHPRFGGRVVFTGNPDKNDVSVTISEVQLSDEGVYHCYVKNPPDRQLGHGVINFNVITEAQSQRDSTIAVIIGASVGGLLAVLILAMVVVKCLRRRKKQELASQEQKLEEEGKNEGREGGAEDSSK